MKGLETTRHPRRHAVRACPWGTGRGEGRSRLQMRCRACQGQAGLGSRAAGRREGKGDAGALTRGPAP